MSGGLNDFFGDVPGRPDHPDFWKLSEVVLGNDGRMEDPDPNALIKLVEEIIDMSVMTYMAQQRAMRPLQNMGVQVIEPDTFALMVSIWMDGFMAGAKYQKSHPKEHGE